MKQNDNLNPLPWYDSLQKQDRFKRYAYGEIFPNISPAWNLLPFQIERPHSERGIRSLDLYFVDGVKFGSILDPMERNGLVLQFGTDTDLIINKAFGSFQYTLPEGFYYAVLSDGENTWYSDIFSCVHDMSRYMMVEWWCDSDLQDESGNRRVLYDTSYHNRLYLDTVMGKPGYDQLEEVETRDLVAMPEKRVSQKLYNFEFMAPEYLCDCVRAIWLSDHIRITSEGVQYNCRTFAPDPKWQDDGHYAMVEVEVEADTVLKRIGSAGPNSTLHYDFNDDFNEDYY